MCLFGLGVLCVCALFANARVMLYGARLFVLFVCAVFARFACGVWRDGV